MDEPTNGSRASPEALLTDIKAIFNNGEFFRAYDWALEGHLAYPHDPRFAHRAVLSLANAGATELALQKLVAFGLDRENTVEVRALLGRLKKDQAFAESGDRRRHLLKEARAIYEAAYDAARRSGDSDAYYPGINAATLALLSGSPADAEALARGVLDLLKNRTDPGMEKEGADTYWVLATALEANLILGDVAAAGELIPAAMKASGMNYAELASTGRQIARILQAKRLSLDIFGAFEPATIVHYAGHLIAPPGIDGRFRADEEAKVRADIERTVDSMRIGAAYGSLAAGSDLLFVEALQKRGVAVNIILPFCIEDMLEQSVRSAGEGWVQRFKGCLDAAKTVRYATEDRYLNDDHLFTYCSSLAMGLAVLAARHMHAPLRQLVVWDGEARSGVAGTVVDMAAWIKAGHPQTVIRSGSRQANDSLESYERPKVARGRRDTRAMLFGDIHGFSKLTDAELPAFAVTIMGAIARVLDRYGSDLCFINTWGDGVFAVSSDAGAAARCALEMQEAMSEIDLEAAGLPSHLRLRLGGHLGPVYELEDPVVKRPNYYGAHVSRAARIEPITPEGCVYVTETFAAVLALHHANQFACDYVGYTEMAKHYGQLRMFLLRRYHEDSGPSVLRDIEQRNAAS